MTESTSHMPHIVLHDLLGAVQPWSENTCRIRYLLNAKRLPFETRWHSYADVESLLKSLGVPPASNEPLYSLPAIQIDDQTIVEPETIARTVERIWPSPSMRLDDPRVIKAGDRIRELAQPMRPLLVPLTADRILRNDPAGRAWYIATREKRMKRSIEEFSRKMGGEAAWARIEEAVEQLMACFEGSGPFILGTEPCWADMKLCSVMNWQKACNEVAFERLYAMDQRLKRHWQAIDFV